MRRRPRVAGLAVEEVAVACGARRWRRARRRGDGLGVARGSLVQAAGRIWMHCLDSGLQAIDEHIECCAGEANDAEREAVLILCAKCHFCWVPRRFQGCPSQKLEIVRGGGLPKRRRIKRSFSCDRNGVQGALYGAGARGGPKIYWLLFKRRRFANERIAAARFTRSCAHHQQPQQHQ